MIIFQSDLKSEIAALQQQLAHNPAVTQYAMENRNLRNENKKLLAMQSVRTGMEYDNDRAQQLEKIFRELLTNMEGKVLSECSNCRALFQGPW